MPAFFAAIFDEVKRTLEEKDIDVDCGEASPAQDADLASFAKEAGIELPNSFTSFFTSFSDGYYFSWDDEASSGRFSMPSLRELVTLREDWLRQVREFADDPSSMDECVDPEHREAAFEIWKRMKSWLPFFEDGSDHFCLDVETGKIVFDKHGWFDGFGEITEVNGLIVGHSLQEFLQNWARFSFEPMWFTDYAHSTGETAIDWSAFDPEE